jgi:uncharacterized repeat protein (TIGR03803 family)
MARPPFAACLIEVAAMLQILDNCILGCGLALAVLIPLDAAHAKVTETVLHSFTGGNGASDGGLPVAGLIQDKKGNLYSTTFDGGGTGCGGYGCGTVFKVTPNGKETVLFSFCQNEVNDCPNGATPYAGLIEDKKGNLFGTAQVGGDTSCSTYDDGCGTVFKLAPNGKYTVLHAFTGSPSDGDGPNAGVIMDSKGNLYGTTLYGASGAVGTVFKLAPDGTETVLYSFCSQSNCTDGQLPHAGVIADKAGNLYGTTDGGAIIKGYEYGTVFKLAPDGTETVLYNFCSQTNCADGANPIAGLIMDSGGNLYGTAEYGGGTITNACPMGCGTVFKLAPDGTETVLYSFCSQTNCADGAFPFAGVIADAKGNLYSTTFTGGDGSSCYYGYGCGTVFEVKPSGKETVLYAFKDSSGDGEYPSAGLLMDSAGNLYSTTYGGGAASYGTVFKLTN